jgi:hypothetical protein
MSKYQQWYNNLPSNTRIWLKNQPVWHDADMVKAVIFGMVLGFLIGVLV